MNERLENLRGSIRHDQTRALLKRIKATKATKAISTPFEFQIAV